MSAAGPSSGDSRAATQAHAELVTDDPVIQEAIEENTGVRDDSRADIEMITEVETDVHADSGTAISADAASATEFRFRILILQVQVQTSALRPVNLEKQKTLEKRLQLP